MKQPTTKAFLCICALLISCIVHDKFFADKPKNSFKIDDCVSYYSELELSRMQYWQHPEVAEQAYVKILDIGARDYLVVLNEVGEPFAMDKSFLEGNNKIDCKE